MSKNDSTFDTSSEQVYAVACELAVHELWLHKTIFPILEHFSTFSILKVLQNNAHIQLKNTPTILVHR